jgi:hypothetical protein
MNTIKTINFTTVLLFQIFAGVKLTLSHEHLQITKIPQL